MTPGNALEDSNASETRRGGLIAGDHLARPGGHGRGRGTARAAVRAGAFFVDPWGPSRLRRWLHVTGARLAVGQPFPARAVAAHAAAEEALAARVAPPTSIAAELVRPRLGGMAGGGAA